MTKLRIMKIGWTSFPLIVDSAALLGAAWFVPDNRDPSGQGDILLSMILMVRALAMRPSKWVSIMGTTLTGIALAGNGGILPIGRWKVLTLAGVVLMCIAILLWDRIASWFGDWKS
jgi:hypothetical protein